MVSSEEVGELLNIDEVEDVLRKYNPESVFNLSFRISAIYQNIVIISHAYDIEIIDRISYDKGSDADMILYKDISSIEELEQILQEALKIKCNYKQLESIISRDLKSDNDLQYIASELLIQLLYNYTDDNKIFLDQIVEKYKDHLCPICKIPHQSDLCLKQKLEKC